MPELPDLQVISHNLNKQLSGKTIVEITLINQKRTKTPATKFKTALENQKLKKIYREGKELRFQCENRNILGIHLMLHGQFHPFDHKNDHDHTILELHFRDKTGLALTDYQGMATPTLNPPDTDAPDALSKSISVRFLKEQLSSSRATIKNWLLNQHIIRGIGNAYADEILWDARISPFSKSNKIPDHKLKTLAYSIHHVLTNAEKEIRQKQPDLISGEIRDFLSIHNAKRTKSPTGSPIQHTKAGAGKTYFTEEQELFD